MPHCRALVSTSCRRRVLPIPASPGMSTTRGLPSCTSCKTCVNQSISCLRPIKGSTVFAGLVSRLRRSIPAGLPINPCQDRLCWVSHTRVKTSVWCKASVLPAMIAAPRLAMPRPELERMGLRATLLAASYRQDVHRGDLVIPRGARHIHRHDVQLAGAHEHHEPRDIITPADGQPGHTRDLRAVDLEGLIGLQLGRDEQHASGQYG